MMMRKIATAAFAGLLLCALTATNASAQTSPNLIFGQVPTPAQWNSFFSGKQDFLGAPPLLTTGGTMIGPLVTAASLTSNAGFNIQPGVAPTSPNNGDLWTTSSSIFVQINGTTYDLIGSPCLNCALTNAANTFTASPQTVQGLTTTAPGWYAQITGDTFARMRLGLNSTDVASVAFGPGNAARDAFIERVGAGFLRFGAPDAALPVQQILSVQNVLAGTSNTGGPATIITGSISTGNQAGGGIVFRVSPGGSSGTAQNAAVNAMQILGTNGVSINSATVHGVLLGQGAGAITSLVGSVSGLPLVGLGSGSDPAFATLTVPGGGTNCNSASITCFNNITGFSAAGSTGTTSTNLVFSGAPTITGHPTIEGVTSTGATGTGNFVFSSAPSIASLTVTTSFTATGLVPLTSLASQASNTILVNATSIGASPTAQSVLSCSGTGAALNWTTNTGIGCNSSITANAVPAANLTGSTLASGVTASSLTSVGTLTSLAVTGALTSGIHTITSNSAHALAVGANGLTNPQFQVDASSASVATGVIINTAAAGSAVGIAAISSATNENIGLDAKGSGSIILGSISTGPITLTRATTISAALTYGGVTLSNAVSGTGNMALTAGTTFTGTTTVATLVATTINGFTAGGAIAMGGNNITGGGTATFTTFSGALTGHASLDLALTGGTMSGAIAMGTNAVTGLTTLASAGALTFQSNGSTTAGTILTNQNWGLGLETNPQATLVVSNNSTTGIAGAGASRVLRLVGANGVNANLEIDVYANAAIIQGARADGTAAAKLAIASADELLLNFVALGYDGSNYYGAASWLAWSAQAFTAGAHGGSYLTAYTTPNNTQTAAEAMRIQNSGGVSIGTTTDEGIGTLNVNGAYYQAGTIGVTCTGTPTSSFASKLGIITHC
jgi:hypothetical protein